MGFVVEMQSQTHVRTQSLAVRCAGDVDVSRMIGRIADVPCVAAHVCHRKFLYIHHGQLLHHACNAVRICVHTQYSVTLYSARSYLCNRCLVYSI